MDALRGYFSLFDLVFLTIDDTVYLGNGWGGDYGIGRANSRDYAFNIPEGKKKENNINFDSGKEKCRRDVLYIILV